ncbi:MAG: AIR synthase-related protein, partial [Syntrophorhabdus sp.]
AAQAMLSVNVHACTDVTGFGLAGHLKEMIRDSIGVELFADKIPYFEETEKFESSGFVPAGLYRNRDFYKDNVVTTRSDFLFDIIFDPQTSGGLLMAIDPADREKFERGAIELGVEYYVIGVFLDEPKGKIILR